MADLELSPLEWTGDAAQGALRLLDQRRLPELETWVECGSVDAAATAIREMVVRGAPAIGLTAAYAMVLAAREARALGGDRGRQLLDAARARLAATRPTAVNLFWALEAFGRQLEQDPTPEGLLSLARALHAEDVAGNRRMAELGASRIPDGAGILTHCNAGALATGGVGTALGPFFVAHRQGKRIHVFVDETRPRLQGARLTAWELARAGVPHTLICDGMAASLMARGKIQLCVTGADRIAANGDAANKIGTYSVAVNASFHRLPFYIAAPVSTFDASLPTGAQIPIEERDPSEVTQWGQGRICPEATPVYNPAFDITPHGLIHALWTDHGEVAPVNAEGISRLLEAARKGRAG